MLAAATNAMPTIPEDPFATPAASNLQLGCYPTSCTSSTLGARAFPGRVGVAFAAAAQIDCPSSTVESKITAGRKHKSKTAETIFKQLEDILHELDAALPIQ